MTRERGHLRLVPPLNHPTSSEVTDASLVAVHRFEHGHEGFRVQLRNSLDYVPYGERFWTFREHEAAQTIGRMVLGISSSEPSEFRGIWTYVVPGAGDWEGSTFVVPTAPDTRSQLLADVIVEHLVTTTNEGLAALGSPYHLPLD